MGQETKYFKDTQTLWEHFEELKQDKELLKVLAKDKYFVGNTSIAASQLGEIKIEILLSSDKICAKKEALFKSGKGGITAIIAALRTAQDKKQTAPKNKKGRK